MTTAHFSRLRFFATTSMAALSLLTAGCMAPQTAVTTTATVTPVTRAVAVVHSVGESNVRGTVIFTPLGSDVRVRADITGLTPGPHGFHVHEFGDASSTDGMSAGGHWNPAQHVHADPASPMRHAGDLGNLVADNSGRATLDYVDPVLKLEGSTSIIGRAVIIHANADDMTTQPTGNAGGRVAIGVIGIAKP